MLRRWRREESDNCKTFSWKEGSAGIDWEKYGIESNNFNSYSVKSSEEQGCEPHNLVALSVTYKVINY